MALYNCREPNNLRLNRQFSIKDFIVDLDFVGMWRIGKLNHRKSETDWRQFGIYMEALCKRLGRNYYIKEDLRAAMNKGRV